MRAVRLFPALILILVIGGCSGAVVRRPPQSPAAVPPGATHVVLVSFDGLRADYLDRFNPPNFARVARAGTRADALLSVFPSKTFPNHYSIATGLYAEHHGIVANAFWDPARREWYRLGDQEAVTDASWYRGEPIWVTAEKQGMRAACYFWPGSEAPIGGVRPTWWKTYDGSVPNEARVDGVLDWLRLPPESRPRMITLYFSDVDTAAHRHGPWSPEARESVMKVDAALGRLLDGLATLPNADDVLLILVSDHGMTETSLDRTTLITDLLADMRGITVADAGPTASLHISGGTLRQHAVRDELNAKLTHGRAYLRTQVPERLHYRADPRIGDVVVVMEEHYMLAASHDPRAAQRFPAGMHGWDPALPSMQGIFLMQGPRVPKGHRIGPIENIDIYPYMTEVLGLRPAARIDGRPGRLAGAISGPTASRLSGVERRLPGAERAGQPSAVP